MGNIETLTKITIKRFIADYPCVAKAIKKGSLTFDDNIDNMAYITKINKDFLIQNIDRIRNWID